MISAFFANKGLVRQQLDSFNEFVNTSMQEIIEEGGKFEVEPQVHDVSQQALKSCFTAACDSGRSESELGLHLCMSHTALLSWLTSMHLCISESWWHGV